MTQVDTGYSVPSGGIILWSGAIANIPQGWFLCDGDNGTPNLEAKFVIHASADSGDTYDVGDTGGALTDTLPNHSHSLNMAGYTGSSPADSGRISVQVPGHTHTTTSTITTQTDGGGGTVDVVPPYYALAYIMKS